jgi:phosphate transport system substrate-binding protein
MKLRLLLSASLLLAALHGAAGQDLSRVPAYKPAADVAGKLVAWGNPEQSAVWEGWVRGFAKYHPRVHFESNLKSSATIAGALCTHVANLGVGGRELMPLEELAFRNIYQHRVTQIVTGSGTYDVTGSTPALGIFVHPDNPLRQLSFTQVDAIFGREHRRGAPENIRTWGQLGLKGKWADQPIHLYGHSLSMPANAYFVAMKVFNGSTKWNPDMKEYGPLEPDGSHPSKGTEILGELAKDPFGIAYTSFDNAKGRLVRSLALAESDDGPFVAPTRDSVAARTYPLTRSTYLFMDRDPVKGFDPTVKEFLRYVLSREGQQVMLDNNYLPLTAEESAVQRARIK